MTNITTVHRITATTAAELRYAVVEWLREEQRQASYRAADTKSVREQTAYYHLMGAFKRAADFWDQIEIVSTPEYSSLDDSEDEGS